jgi:uncharacterized membrane protein
MNSVSTTHGGRWTLERRLSIVLRYGTWVACALIAAGLGCALLASHAPASDTAIRLATQLVTVGIAVLLLLPVLRVMLMAIAFAWERDYLFVGIATLVLAVIGLGLVLGSR